MTKKLEAANLQEKVVTGGGATGQSQGPEPTGTKAAAPGPSKHQGDLTPKKLEGEMQETDPQNNTKPTADTSASNKASVAMKEAVEAMFVGQDLSEEFKAKASVVFEAAVNAKIEEIRAELTEEYDQSFATKSQEIAEQLAGKLDEYLDYVAKEWLEENQVAIEHSIRNELTEDFIASLKTVFEEHYVSVPEDKVNVVEELAQRVEELEAQLNDTINENIELKKISASVERDEVFAEVSEGLAQTQVEKLQTLSEGIVFEDVETFRKKLTIVKENYFPSDKKVSSVITEEVEELAENTVRTPAGPMSRYVSAISRTAKN